MRQELGPEHEFCKRVICQRKARLLGAVLMLLGCVSSCWAQWDSSGLTGTVTDSSGHGLPGVTVTAVQKAKGFERKVTTSAEGAYYFPKLPLGDYTVSFDLKDFQPVRFDDVVQKLEQTR